jgi:hypothetical protein
MIVKLWVGKNLKEVVEYCPGIHVESEENREKLIQDSTHTGRD